MYFTIQSFWVGNGYTVYPPPHHSYLYMEHGEPLDFEVLYTSL